MAKIMARYRLPDKEAKELPMTIEITMSVSDWERLDLGTKYPDWKVSVIIMDALAGFSALAGSEVVIGDDWREHLAERM